MEKTKTNQLTRKSADMNKKELEKLIGHKRQKPHKFGAVRTRCKWGHSHPSKVEAWHCWALHAEMDSHLIKDLEYEKSYDLKCNGVVICVHKPDFTYKRRVIVSEPTGPHSSVQTSIWVVHVDEVKGFKTPDWVVKSKLFQAQFPDIVYRVI